MGRRRTLRGDPSIMKHVIGQSGADAKRAADQNTDAKRAQNFWFSDDPQTKAQWDSKSGSTPAIAQSLKITKQKSTKKKKELPFTPSTISKGSAPKGTGRGRSGPIKSAVAGALGSSSGGSVRL